MNKKNHGKSYNDKHNGPPPSSRRRARAMKKRETEQYRQREIIKQNKDN